MKELTNFRDNKYTPKVHVWDRERQILGEPMIHPSLIPNGYVQSWNEKKLCWFLEVNPNGDQKALCECGKTKRLTAIRCVSCNNKLDRERSRLQRLRKKSEK